jgi:hypothetical protein
MLCLRNGLCSATLLATVSFLASASPDDSSTKFGFTGPEIFPIDNQIGQLHFADLDGDGLNDIILVNNSRSKINLLYNQTGKTNVSQKVNLSGRQEINQLPPDARFRIDSIASEKRISSLVVADVNGDGRRDLAYYGEPKELVIQYNEGTNNWSTPRRFPIDDGQLSPNALGSGDLNGDGRPDIILLAEHHLYLLTQKKDRTLDEPQKIPVGGVVKSVQIVDVDGDGLSDLLLVNWEDRNPFRFRLQKQGGELGPENYFALPAIRSYWADSLEANRKTQIMTIAQNSGRAQISEFSRKAAEPLSDGFVKGQFQLMPLIKTDKARRGLLWADINGDKLADLLVAEPESGQISLFLQEQDGSLAAGKTFPTLAGVSELAVADYDNNGKPDIFLLSSDERQVGMTRLDDKQRLPFPTLMPMEGKPLVLAAGKLNPESKPTLAVIVDKDGKRFLFTRSFDGKTKTQPLSSTFKSNPTSITFHDADQDGLVDLIVLIPYEKVKILRQVPEKDFEELDIALPGGGLEQPWLSTADINGDGKPELLLTQKNFLRAVVLKSEASAQSSTNLGGWTFNVKEQINGSTSNSRLIGATAVPNSSNTVPSLFLLDADRKALTLCERDRAGVWQVVRNLPVPVSDFTSLKTISFGATNRTAVAFMGLNAVAWMPLSGDVWDLVELDSYETSIKDGRLNDVVSGDLNHDGRKDLVFLETARNYLDLVIFDANHKLVPANRWQVFEERTFRNRRSEMPEPREAAVVDVTGDGKNDLIVLVHDRILLYPQE